MSVVDGPNFSSSENLIFYLDAVNPKSYPGTGSTWYDVSGNNNHFTLFNTPTYTSNGTTGTYLTFNGTNQYARSANAINFNAYSAVTIEIGYRTTVTNATQILYETTGTGGSTATGGITLLMNSDNTSTSANVYLSMWQGYGPRLVTFTRSTNTTFNSITETFVNGIDSSGRSTYINGLLANFATNSSVTTATSTTTSGLLFANTYTYVASRAGTRNFFNGDIAWIKAFGTKISSSTLISNLNLINLRQPASYTGTTILSSITGAGTTASIVLTASSSVTSRFGDDSPTVTSFFSGLTSSGLYTSTGTGDYTGYYKFVLSTACLLTFTVGGASGGYSTQTSGTYLNYKSRGRLITGSFNLPLGTEVQFFSGKFGQSGYGGGGGGASMIAIKSGGSLIPIIVTAGGGSFSSGGTVNPNTAYNAAALSITPATAASARAVKLASNNFNVVGGGGWGRANISNAGFGGSGWLYWPVNSAGQTAGYSDNINGPQPLSLGAQGGYPTSNSAGTTGGFGGGGGGYAANYYGGGGGGYNGGCESGESASALTPQYATYSTANTNFYDDNFAAISYVNTTYCTNAVDAGLNGGNPSTSNVGGVVNITLTST